MRHSVTSASALPEPRNERLLRAFSFRTSSEPRFGLRSALNTSKFPGLSQRMLCFPRICPEI
jgi:hypothetical protein